MSYTCEVCGTNFIDEDFIGFINLERIHYICDHCLPIVSDVMDSAFMTALPVLKMTVEEHYNELKGGGEGLML